MTVEERLTSALHEVADRLPERPMAPPSPVETPERRPIRWLLRAAAAILVVAATATYLLARDDEPVPVATETPRTLLTSEMDYPGGEVRLETAGVGCVALSFSQPFETPTPREACLGSDAIAVWATSRAGETFVYGIAAGAARFTGSIEEVTTADLHDARVDDRAAAFLMVIPVPMATGTVTAVDADDRIIATGAFDHGGPARPPKGTLGDRVIDFAYLRDGAIWIRTTDGDDTRVSDGTADAADGYPLVLPDGHTIVHSVPTSDMPFDAVVATDTRDGSVRDLQLAGTGLLALSPDGSQIAATRFTDDSSATVELILLDAHTFAEVTQIPIGIWDDVGDLWDASWDTDGHSVLVTTRCCFDQETGSRWVNRLWSADLNNRTVVELHPGTDAAQWFLADRTSDPQSFPLLRRTGSSVEWGSLNLTGGTPTASEGHFEGGSPSFDACCPIQADAGLNLDGDLYLSPHGDGHWLVGDGQHLFELNVAGHLTLLMNDVHFATSP